MLKITNGTFSPISIVTLGNWIVLVAENLLRMLSKRLLVLLRQNSGSLRKDATGKFSFLNNFVLFFQIMQKF